MTIQVFQMNDFAEWWAGESLEACAEAANHETGAKPGDDYVYPQEGYGMVVSDADMQRIKYEADDGTVRTFAEQLAKEIADGTKFPCLFAASDN